MRALRRRGHRRDRFGRRALGIEREQRRHPGPQMVERDAR